MPKLTLYNAISIDGFIAGPNDETPWSNEEWHAFRELVKTFDVCLIGRRTYEVMRDGGEFVEGPQWIVVTSNKDLDTGDFEKRAIHSAADLPDVNTIGVIGGGELQGSLAMLGLIDEIITDVESVTLGQGKHMFGSYAVKLELELRSFKPVGPKTMQNRYRVVK
jgi:dihydrofolate reductase